MSLYRKEVFLKSHTEACFHELKMTPTSEEFTKHGFDIRTYLCILLSYLQRTNCTLKRKDQNQDTEK